MRDSPERQGFASTKVTTYGSSYEGQLALTDGENLTDGGAWTDVEALTILRQRRLRDGSTSSEDTPPVDPKTPWYLFFHISTIGFAVDFAWAAMEAVMVPHLVEDMGASMQTASLIWLANPVFGVFVQPLLGQVMDRWGTDAASRRPFIMGLAILALVGILVLVFLSTIQQVFHLSFPVTIIVCFISFGIADIAHDCLLIPGRVLICDIATPLNNAEIYDKGHALFSGMQCAGHLAAEFLGMVPLMALGLPAAFDPYHSLLIISGLLIAGCCTWTCLHLHPEPLPPPSTPSTPDSLAFRSRSLDLNLLRLVKRRRGPRVLPAHALALPIMECQQRRRRWAMPLPAPFAVNEKTENDSGHTSVVEVLEERALIVLVLLLTGFGWISTCAISFYWTTWLGIDSLVPGTALRLSFFTLCIQAVTSIVATALLPWLNQIFGELPVFMASQLSFAICMALTVVWQGPVGVLVLSLLLGIMPAIHPNNSLTICERMVDSPRLRASVISLVNTTMPVAQIIVGLASGPLISHLGGDIALYFALIGVLHIVVLAISSGIFLIEKLTE